MEPSRPFQDSSRRQIRALENIDKMTPSQRDAAIVQVVILALVILLVASKFGVRISFFNFAIAVAAAALVY